MNQFTNFEGWRIDCLRDWLPKVVVHSIYAIFPPLENNEPDTLMWKGTFDGSFSVKSAYNMILNLSVPSSIPSN